MTAHVSAPFPAPISCSVNWAWGGARLQGRRELRAKCLWPGTEHRGLALTARSGHSLSRCRPSTVETSMLPGAMADRRRSKQASCCDERACCPLSHMVRSPQIPLLLQTPSPDPGSVHGKTLSIFHLDPCSGLFLLSLPVLLM